MSNGVDCSITAGIAKTPGATFVAENAGWFIFCNFRAVIFSDKTQLTGWGRTIPQFQPKHRPFLGIVSFTSANPELLPWTTTKGSISEDSLVWQEAKSRMGAIAKPILRLLDARYTDEGTDIAPKELADLSGESTNVFKIVISKNRNFTSPPKKLLKDVSVQYYAKREELDAIKKHFSRSYMSAKEIGRTTFDYFLKNEIGSE